MTALLAQAAGYSLIQLIIIGIIVCAVVGIAMVAVKHFGIVVPQAVWMIIWILIVAAVAIIAIRFLLTL